MTFKPLTRLALLLSILLLASAGFADDCLDCHQQQSPGLVAHYQQSAHAGKVDCSGCHGEDHDNIVAGSAKVTADTCGACHAEALEQHRKSKHGQGLHSGWGCTRNRPDRDPQGCSFCHAEGSTIPVSLVHCARFLTQSAEMKQAGCNRCHQVEDSCASCHSNHQTDLTLVRDPGVCGKCHMGPDHPQWEMWQTSQHGQLYLAGGPSAGPGCQVCHMPIGSHDVSVGITNGPTGKPLDEAERLQQRQAMSRLCKDCHAESFVRAELERGDRIRQQSQALVAQARELIGDLADRGLLQPMPDQRPEHPLRGHELVLDGQMLYENISHIERLYFKMMKYDFAKTWKGAFHQNPAYTHWYGNAELKMDLADIQAEAERLKQGSTTQARVGFEPEDPIQAELQRLKNQFERGGLSESDYQREKAILLKFIER